MTHRYRYKTPQKGPRPIRRFVSILLLCAVLAGAVLFLSMSIPPTRGYRAVTAREGAFSVSYHFSGTVYAPRRTAQMAETACTVKKLYRTDGESIKKGDAILKTSRGQTLYAPRTGTLQGLTLTEGQMVTPGELLYTVADYRDLRIRFFADEQDITAIRNGAAVSVTFPAREGEEPRAGIISYLSKEAAEQKGSVPCFEVQVVLEDTRDLACGMSAQVTLITEQLESAVLLPMEAIMTDEENRPFVYYLSKGRMAAKYISLGPNDGVHGAVTGGISANETVYIPQKSRTTVDPMDFIREGD